MQLFKGRINIATFVAGHVLLYAVYGVILGLFYYIWKPLPLDWSPAIITVFVSIFVMCQLSLSIRRLHDAGYDGSYFWVGTLYLGYPGQKGQNRWGIPPKPGIHFKAMFGL